MFGANTSGLEMMLRNMGLASVLDAAKALAESGAVQKIIEFADNAGEMNERLARIEKALGVAASNGGSGLIEGTAVELRRASDEPGSGAAARDVA